MKTNKTWLGAGTALGMPMRLLNLLTVLYVPNPAIV